MPWTETVTMSKLEWRAGSKTWYSMFSIMNQNTKISPEEERIAMCHGANSTDTPFQCPSLWAQTGSTQAVRGRALQLYVDSRVGWTRNFLGCC
jgi:hypothetical protein